MISGSLKWGHQGKPYYDMINILIKRGRIGAGEMAYWLRAISAFSEDPVFSVSTTRGTRHMVLVHACRHMCIHKITNNNKRRFPLGIVAHLCNPSTQKAKAGGLP